MREAIGENGELIPFSSLTLHEAIWEAQRTLTDAGLLDAPLFVQADWLEEHNNLRMANYCRDCASKGILVWNAPEKSEIPVD
jgi:hypothetical protein